MAIIKREVINRLDWPLVGGGIEAFHVENGGNSIESAYRKHHLIYHLKTERAGN